MIYATTACKGGVGASVSLSGLIKEPYDVSEYLMSEKKKSLRSSSVQQEPWEPSGWGCWRQNSSQTFNSFGLKQLCSLQECQTYVAHRIRPCVIRFLSCAVRELSVCRHSFLSLGMFWFSSAFEMAQRKAVIFQLTGCTPQTLIEEECLCPSCALSK